MVLKLFFQILWFDILVGYLERLKSMICNIGAIFYLDRFDYLFIKQV